MAAGVMTAWVMVYYILAWPFGPVRWPGYLSPLVRTSLYVLRCPGSVLAKGGYPLVLGSLELLGANFVARFVKCSPPLRISNFECLPNRPVTATPS